VALKKMPSAKEPTHGYSEVVAVGEDSKIMVSAGSAGAARLRAAGALGDGAVAGAGLEVPDGAPTRQTLSRLMQVFPQGIPLRQLRWASALLKSVRRMQTTRASTRLEGSNIGSFQVFKG
jgi:hypothetical protein